MRILARCEFPQRTRDVFLTTTEYVSEQIIRLDSVSGDTYSQRITDMLATVHCWNSRFFWEWRFRTADGYSIQLTYLTWIPDWISVVEYASCKIYSERTIENHGSKTQLLLLCRKPPLVHIHLAELEHKSIVSWDERTIIKFKLLQTALNDLFSFNSPYALLISKVRSVCSGQEWTFATRCRK